MLKHATKVVATSDNELQAYQRSGIPTHKIFMVGHGVDKTEFETPVSKQASRRSLKLKTGATIITFLGRIHRIKGLDLLVKAIAKIKDSSTHFVIAGSDDGYLKELKSQLHKLQIQDRVTLLGTCFGETKAKLFKATDIFVYPSYSEGFSLGILEALAAGLPLIITTGCHFSLVAKENAGIEIEPDETKLAHAITKLAADSQLRQKMSANATQLIEQHYSMKKIGTDLLDMYQGLSSPL